MEYPKFYDSSRLLSIDFEVDGLVHGVSFRRYTLQAADRLGVRGWVKKAPTGSVTGTIQGDKGNVVNMMRWMSTVGSPEAVIQGCTFRNEREIINHEYNKFSITPNDW